MEVRKQPNNTNCKRNYWEMYIVSSGSSDTWWCNFVFSVLLKVVIVAIVLIYQGAKKDLRATIINQYEESHVSRV